jgi:hypothetical protein
MSVTDFIAGIAAIFSVLTLVLILELFAIGQPPKHCRYFVPVHGKPGIYSCSEHPRPVNP